MKQEQLLPLVRNKVVELLNGYVPVSALTVEKIENYIVLPKLGDNAGLAGSIALGMEAHRTEKGYNDKVNGLTNL